MVTILSWVHWTYSMKTMAIQATVSNGQTLDYNRFLSKGYNFLGTTWRKHQIRILKYRKSDGPYVVFFLYIYSALNMSMLKIYQPNFYFMFCSLQGQNQGFFLKRNDHFKTFVWYGSLVSTCFQQSKDLSPFVGSRLIGRSRLGSSLLGDSIRKSHDFVVFIDHHVKVR